jgi:hypothetical protein
MGGRGKPQIEFQVRHLTGLVDIGGTFLCHSLLGGGVIEIFIPSPSVVAGCSSIKPLCLLPPSPVLVLCKADTSCGLSSRVVQVFTIGHLYSVGALLVGGIIKFNVGISTFTPFPCEVSSPCTVLDVGVWKPKCALKGGPIGIERKIVVFVELWLESLLLPLVSISLA